MKIKLIAIAFLLIVFGSAAPAQTSRGTVSGTITDSNGAVIPGAEITLTSDATGISRTTTTNGEGFYRFDAVELGEYTVAATATNFGTVTRPKVVVSANQTSTVEAQLAPGTQTETIEVTATGGESLQSEAPVRGGNISPRQISQLPIAAASANNNPVGLALTLPGVSSNRSGVGIESFSVNGARSRSNNFLLDGTENNDISVNGQGSRINNADAVQEVSVQTSNYDAEFGRAGGAVVNVITKAGTNDYRGTLAFLYDTRSDDALTTPATARARAPSTTSAAASSARSSAATSAAPSSCRASARAAPPSTTGAGARSSSATITSGGSARRVRRNSRRSPPRAARGCANFSPPARASTLTATSI
jgi:hypothetical protein